MYILVFDDLMTDVKCDQRIADMRYQREPPQEHIHSLSHSEFISSRKSVQRYTVHGAIDRQQVATLARRIYPPMSAIFMKRFEEATQVTYRYISCDCSSLITEKDHLNS